MKLATKPEKAVFVNADGCVYSEDGTTLISAPEKIRGCAVLEGCTAIAPNAFKACSQLSWLELPESLREVGPYAFSFTGLEEFTCPPGLRVIGTKAFYSCSGLKVFHANEGLESLGDEAFDATALRELHLPASLSSIGRRLLRRSWLAANFAPGRLDVNPENPSLFIDTCGALYARRESGFVLLELMVSNVRTHRVLPGTVRISSGAYRLNRVIEQVDLPEGVKEVGGGAFRMCTALERVGIPETLEVIGPDAFYQSSLRALYLPAGFERLGMCALVTQDAEAGSLPSLEEITVSSQNPRFFTRDGFLIEHREHGDFLVCHFGREEIVQVPACVSTLGPYSLAGCERARALVLHEGISRIHSTAFMLDQPIGLVRVILREPVEGQDHLDLCFPRHSTRNTTFARAFYRPLSKWIRVTDANARVRGLFSLGTSASRHRKVMRDNSRTPAGIVEACLEDSGAAAGLDAGPEPSRPSSIPAPGVSSSVRDFSNRSAFAIDEYEGGLDLSRLCDCSDHAIFELCHEPRPFAVLALRRLEHPLFLADAHRAAMARRLEDQVFEIVAECARCGDVATVGKLVDVGIVNEENIASCIDAANKISDIALSSFLLQIRRERFGQATFDFGI